MNYLTWARRTRDDQAELDREAQDEAARAATAGIKVCPGISVDHDLDEDPPPTRYRDDTTARRAQALFDMHH